MTTKDSQICGAPWCNRPTRKASHGTSIKVGKVEVCKACNQHVWNQAKKMGKKVHEVLFQVPLPHRVPPRIETKCARENCPVIFKAGEGCKTKDGKHGRTYIGGKPVCHTCRQTALEVSQEKGISLIEAFAQLPPKGVWRNFIPKPVAMAVPCCMPWCSSETFDTENNKLSENLFVCKPCRKYLKRVKYRLPIFTERTWQEWALEALTGRVPSPHDSEKCVLPWCGREVKNDATNRNGKRISVTRGPNGEPICSTCRMYLYLYSKKNKISIHEAFHQAPKPKQRKGTPRNELTS